MTRRNDTPEDRLVSAVAARCPQLSGEQVLKVAAAMLREVADAIANGRPVVAVYQVGGNTVEVSEIFPSSGRV